jgi:hypothetical protein
MMLAIKTPPGGIPAGEARVELDVFRSNIQPMTVGSLRPIPGLKIRAKNVTHRALPGDTWFAVDSSSVHVMHTFGE